MPAVAVIRVRQALFMIIRSKGCVDGLIIDKHKLESNRRIKNFESRDEIQQYSKDCQRRKHYSN